MNILDNLKEQGVSESLIKDIEHFRKEYDVKDELKERVTKSPAFFIGKDILEMCITGILEEENILLSGPKATGKNLLSDNLSEIFGRPQWNTSFHINTDSASLIGTDTFIDNEVKLRRGSVYECAVNGGFGIFEEINMAKNDAIVVLHSALGYERIKLHPATRFIGTMNYEYAGTKELNEALVSRFLVIDIPAVDEEKLKMILKREFPTVDEEKLLQFIGIFMDLQLKAENGEISTKAIDLRGMIGALKTIKRGLKPTLAINMGITGKTFDIYEKEMVSDIIRTRIPEGWESFDIFPND